jgi:hypothetical protein
MSEMLPLTPVNAQQSLGQPCVTIHAEDIVHPPKKRWLHHGVASSLLCNLLKVVAIS